ncbi:MAG: hypothetical protein R2568_11600 [Candidatus Scalindua sp.]|nr:hypothetical protein [Candidatus Scalindua sp.]
MSEVGDALQQLELKAKNIDELSDMMVQYFFDNLGDTQTGEKSSVLVRFFMTYPYSSLETELQQSADKMLGAKPEDQDMKCLKLLGTAGVQPEWSSTIESKSHRIIPLQNEEKVKKIFYMIYEFIDQMGMDISNVLYPDTKLSSELEERIFDVYHVPEALGNPHIPAQKDFIIPFGVKSLMGFGGMLPTGNLFIMLIFSKTKIPHKTANLFKNTALHIRMAALPFVNEKIFVIDKDEITEEERLRSLIATQRSLLEVYKTTTESTKRSESVSFNIANVIGKFTKKIWLYVCLIFISAFFLFVHWLTHNEFTLHLAAIPIEILFGALLIEKILERKRKVEQSKRLMHFRCYLFRSRLRNIFHANLNALKFPIISISKIKNASLEELKQIRKDADHIEYASLDAMETIIEGYVPAYHAFYSFMEWTIIHDIDSDFKDMIYILHFIEEVKQYKHSNPDTPYVYEAQKNRSLMKKVKKVLAEGLCNFLEFLI